MSRKTFILPGLESTVGRLKSDGCGYGIELYPDPPARLSEEELLFSKQKLQKLKIFARLEIVSLQKRHY